MNTLSTTHGQPWTRSDRERRVRRMVERHGDWSLRLLADWCGCDHTTIKKYRDESGVGKPTPGDVRTGRDGKQYPAIRTPKKKSTDVKNQTAEVRRDGRRKGAARA